MKHDFLLEIGCEEIPAELLTSLASTLSLAMTAELANAQLTHQKVHTFATPRRLALLITDLIDEQATIKVEKWGPGVEQAYQDGKPTTACIGFARSCGIEVEQLTIKETPKGERVYYLSEQQGKKTHELLPTFINNAVKKLAAGKAMRWGDYPTQFIRPVHWIVLMYGQTVVPMHLLEKQTTNTTYGHRFHHPQAIQIHDVKNYQMTLAQNFVIADFEKRKELIREKIIAATNDDDHAIINEDLLQEVTGLVEWPVALVARFKTEFLKVPKEVLITSMQTHQKCFAVENNKGELQPYFILISNIESKDPATVVLGNERVINARLADAAFFYKQDLKHPLASRMDSLKGVIFQKELGTLAEKTQRLMALAKIVAKSLNLNPELAERAATLAKCDLVSEMVYEFPNLQGIMGYYYALHDNESEAAAAAIKEHYYPRFSGDILPKSDYGALIALLDRLDTLIGILGVNQAPTADKDPFALRRATQGIIRILIEKEWSLDLLFLLEQAKQHYSLKLPNADLINQAFDFIMARLRSWYLEQNIEVETFEAVVARRPTQLYDFNQRLLAVRQFQTLPEASTLAAANKRVSNILKKIDLQKLPALDSNLLVSPEEKTLAELITKQITSTQKLYEKADYTQALQMLSTLKTPIDNFFDKVMVMVDDEKLKNNRLALLFLLQQLLSQVADISLLSK